MDISRRFVAYSRPQFSDSYHLAKELMGRRLSHVGTIYNNRKEIPREMLPDRRRDLFFILQQVWIRGRRSDVKKQLAYTYAVINTASKQHRDVR